MHRADKPLNARTIADLNKLIMDFRNYASFVFHLMSQTKKKRTIYVAYVLLIFPH